MARAVLLPLLALSLLAAPARAGDAAGRADSLAIGQTVTGGYAEAVVRAPDATTERGQRATSAPNEATLRAGVHLRKRVASETIVQLGVTWEAADAGAEGQLRIESAGAEWSRSPRLRVQAGQLLVPSGMLNLAHAPGDFHGALRPDVETLVIPSTWSALGVGASGVLAHSYTWTLDLLQGLDAARFSAAGRFRDGRPDGARTAFRHPAVAVRLDWQSQEALLIGGSIVTGDAWQAAQGDTALHPRTWVNEAHARFTRGGLDVRALYTTALLWDHAALSRALGVAGTDAALGKRAFGGEVEASYDVLPRAWPRASGSLRPYARFELTDTQDGVGAIGTENPLFHRTNLTVGLEFAPAPGVILKADRQQRHHEDGSGVSQWNVAFAFGF